MESGIEGWMSVKEMMPDPDVCTVLLLRRAGGRKGEKPWTRLNF